MGKGGRAAGKFFRGVSKAAKAFNEADKRNTAKLESRRFGGTFDPESEQAKFAKENGYTKDRYGNWREG